VDANGLWLAPVEYAVAVDRYLDSARLTPASRRVYRISLNTWSWLLIGRTPPRGADRKGVRPPIVPLARLDGPDAAARLHDARERRALMVDERTVEREAAILRTALRWWAERGWISPSVGDGLKPLRAQASDTPADRSVRESAAVALESTATESIDAGPVDAGPVDVEAVFTLRAPLREQALWHLIFESAAPIEHVLALDAADLDLHHRRVRRRIAPGPTEHINWDEGAAALLPLLLVGRRVGPVFLTERRAPAGTPAADRCPHSGRGRLSTRRAAELFRAATAPLDPSGHGWTLRDLRLAGRVRRAG
jgi:integrase/recombinase XerD